MQSFLPQPGIILWLLFFVFDFTRTSLYLWIQLCSVTVWLLPTFLSVPEEPSLAVRSVLISQLLFGVRWVLRYFFSPSYSVSLVGRAKTQPGLLSAFQLYWYPSLNPTPLKYKPNAPEIANWSISQLWAFPVPLLGPLPGMLPASSWTDYPGTMTTPWQIQQCLLPPFPLTGSLGYRAFSAFLDSCSSAFSNGWTMQGNETLGPDSCFPQRADSLPCFFRLGCDTYVSPWVLEKHFSALSFRKDIKEWGWWWSGVGYSVHPLPGTKRWLMIKCQGGRRRGHEASPPWHFALHHSHHSAGS